MTHDERVEEIRLLASSPLLQHCFPECVRDLLAAYDALKADRDALKQKVEAGEGES